jgi:phosphate/sulfate permease
MTIYLLIIIVLVLLASIDLTVGVANDAVNFLNSAVGGKVARYNWIVFIAGIGVILGSIFSGGMMEVARKGIFNPQYFSFSDIIYIFVAVMIADILLLDLFNTFGLPTSTTVSIVFDLLGAAVGMAFMKINYYHNATEALETYINSANALKIIFSILLSIVVAFTFGLVIQWVARIIFSFNFTNIMRYLGGVWGGLITTGILYFLFLKGLKHASFVSDAMKDTILNNQDFYLIVTFLALTVLLQILIWITHFNVLRFTVLLGTFALAMAFASNDLVNFIGVPIAGINSYSIFLAHPGADAHSFLMTDLAGKVPVNPLYLLTAGIIMIVTLFVSKKTKTVIKTSIDLARQDTGHERFGSSALSRGIVRFGDNVNKALMVAVPRPVNMFIRSRFDKADKKMDAEAPAFDLIRATVNLFVASILISIATTEKLPLSTTYVTFMVAMGSSLADRAWGGDSAVYRISGVLTIVGGWFLTAFSAFIFAFVLIAIIVLGSFPAIFVLFGLTIFVMIRTKILHKKLQDKATEREKNISYSSGNEFLNDIIDIINKSFVNIKEILGYIGKGLTKNDLGEVKKGLKIFKEIIKQSEYRLKESVDSINKINTEEVLSTYLEFTLSFKQMSQSLNQIVSPVHKHISNNHRQMAYGQIDDLKTIFADYSHFLDVVGSDFRVDASTNYEEITKLKNDLLEKIKSIKKAYIKFMKKNNIETSTNSNVLFFDIIYETKILAWSTYDLYETFIEMKDALPEE